MIRLFKDKDAKDCSEIMLKCIGQFKNYSRENKKFLVKVSQPNSLIEKSKNLLFYVYEKEGKILGTGAFDKGEIRTMFVDPEHQKKGIGQKILDFLIKQTKSKDCTKVWLGANPEAEGFYKKKGFRKIREDNEFNFRTIIMEKKI